MKALLLGPGVEMVIQAPPPRDDADRKAFAETLIAVIQNAGAAAGAIQKMGHPAQITVTVKRLSVQPLGQGGDA